MTSYQIAQFGGLYIPIKRMSLLSILTYTAMTSRVLYALTILSSLEGRLVHHLQVRHLRPFL